MGTFAPRLEVLSPGQRALWQELGHVPDYFTLYGDAAASLRLGHRPVDRLEFKTAWDFRAEQVRNEIPWLKDASISHESRNRLTASVEREGERVQVAFTGGLDIGRVAAPDECVSNELNVASLLDVAATKVIEMRDHSASHDYIELVYMMGAGLPLTLILGAAAAISHCEFSPEEAIENLIFFETDDETKRLLAQEASQIRKVPNVPLEANVITPWLDTQITANAEVQNEPALQSSQIGVPARQANALPLLTRDTVSKHPVEEMESPVIHPRTEGATPVEQELWQAFAEAPSHFVLYGQAAVGIRLGMQWGEDFVFRSAKDFDPAVLRDQLSCVREDNAHSHRVSVREFGPNNLSVLIGEGLDSVSVRFEGGIKSGQLEFPTRCADNNVAVASLADLGAWTLVEFRDSLPNAGGHQVDALAQILSNGPKLEGLLAGARTLAPDRCFVEAMLQDLKSLDRPEVNHTGVERNEVDRQVAEAARAVKAVPVVTVQSSEICATPQHQASSQPQATACEAEL